MCRLNRASRSFECLFRWIVDTRNRERRGRACARQPDLPSGWKIQHVIILVQENRTFDNLFHGFPGADYAKTGLTHTGKTVRLKPGHLVEPYDLGHSHANFVTEYDNGKNDGFDLVPTSPSGYKLAPYQYVVQSRYGRTSTSRMSLRWVTICSRRRTARVSPATNT